MRRFQFALEQVLRLKRQRERLAEARLQQAHAVDAAARAAVVALQEQIAQAEVATRAGQPVAMALWIAQAHHVERLGQALAAAQTRAQRTGQDVKAAAVLRTQIATEVEALRNLRHRQWQAHRHEMARREQDRLDEVGMRRWQQKQSPPGEDRS